ncbi:MAG: hypothetical protein ABI239_06805 [Aquihabitans sp.]
MGWKNRIKQAVVDVEGVRVGVEGPPEFRWSDGTLPVTISLFGGGEQDQMVTQVEVKVEQVSDETMFLYTLPVRQPVPVGQTIRATIQVPLVLDDRPIDAAELDQVPGFMKALIRRVAMGKVGFTGPCSLKVMTTYENNRRPGAAKAKIEAVG